jgi:hypothetical protein
MALNPELAALAATIRRALCLTRTVRPRQDVIPLVVIGSLNDVQGQALDVTETNDAGLRLAILSLLDIADQAPSEIERRLADALVALTGLFSDVTPAECLEVLDDAVKALMHTAGSQPAASASGELRTVVDLVHAGLRLRAQAPSASTDTIDRLVPITDHLSGDYLLGALHQEACSGRY